MKDAPVGVKIIASLYFLSSLFVIVSTLYFLFLGSDNFDISLVLMTLLIGIVGSLIPFEIGRGLWKGKGWARWTVMVFAVLALFMSLPTFLVAGFWGVLLTLLHPTIYGYLRFHKGVKHYFAVQ